MNRQAKIAKKKQIEQRNEYARSELERGFCTMAEGIAEIVFADDYYEGEWYIWFGSTRRKCANYTTAIAWQKYIKRRFGNYAYAPTQKVVPNKPGWEKPNDQS